MKMLPNGNTSIANFHVHLIRSFDVVILQTEVDIYYKYLVYVTRTCSLMAQWLRLGSQLHTMHCHDLEVMCLNPC